MLPKFLTALSLALIIFSGCQKEIEKNTLSSNSSLSSNSTTTGTKDTTGRWYGTYEGYYEDPDKYPDTITEKSLIYNGMAPNPGITPYDWELSSVGYYLPADRNISGDSITFTASLLNKSGIVQMDIIGTKNIAHATCSRKGDSSIVEIAVGNATISSVIKPAIDFSTFRRVSLVLKKNKAVFMVGDESKTNLQFLNADRIGVVQRLSMGFNNNLQPHFYSVENGVILCTGVHLYNSYTKALIMQETFSHNGKSDTVFY